MTRDMTTGRPTGVILRFAIPIILGNMLQQLYNIVDAAIVGQHLGLTALAGVGASSSVLFLIIGFCNGCGAGFGIPIAQFFGARDYSSMRKCLSGIIMLYLIITGILTALTASFCRDILVMIRTPQEIMDDAYAYLLITFLGIPFTFGYNILAAVIRALGDSRTPFLFLLLATVLNILLDFALILGLDMGTGGAALATLISQAVSALLCLRYIGRRCPILRRNADERRIEGRYVKLLLGMGVPMGLQFSITAVGSIMLQSANNALGTACVAAFTAANRIKMFFICVIENLGVAMATFCGQNLGAGKLDRIRSGIWAAIRIGAIYAVFTFSVLHTFQRDITLLFVSRADTDVLDMSSMFLATSSCMHIVLVLLCVFRYSIQGLGFSRLALVSGVCEMVTRTLMSLFLIPNGGFKMVCMGDPAAWTSGVLFLIPAFAVIYRKLQRCQSTGERLIM